MSLVEQGARTVRGAIGLRAAALALAVTSPLRSPAADPLAAPPTPLPSESAGDTAWLAGAQVTSTGVIVPGMRSPYRSPDTSFGEDRATAGWSLVVTGFAGARPWDGAVVVAQPEFSDGAGAPNVSGVAGYVDGNIERAVSAGAEVPTDGWARAGDHVGLGVAVNGLSPSHVRYLRAGGADFQLGDGTLRYRPEIVTEAYYALHVGRTVVVTADVQGTVDPGMNADRGPALAIGIRLHAHL